MDDMNLQALSRQEEAELARSNKKIKDGHHASFREGERVSSDQGLELGLARKS